MLKKTVQELNRLSFTDYLESDKRKFVIVLDNIRSMHNVGAAFRIADSFLAEKIILCGITATPPRNEISKTALGAEDYVKWSYFSKTLDAINHLKENGFTIIAIELCHNSIPLKSFIYTSDKKYAFVFGNEVSGVDEIVLQSADSICEIEQFGSKHSLNVSVALGIVSWNFAIN